MPGPRSTDLLPTDILRYSARDTLYRNRGNGTFKNVTRLVGIDKAPGNGLGVTTGDFNGDGHVDIYVVNRSGPNRLWLNNGKGKFTEEARLQGCALNHTAFAEASAGVVAEDVEHDGDLDLLVSQARGEAHAFFRNLSPWFVDESAAVGLGVASAAYTGFGIGMSDFDHDGHLDLYVANGRVAHLEPRMNPRDPFAEPNQLFAGKPNGTFREVEPRGGLAGVSAATSRGAAFGDLDNDVDIVVANRAGKARVYRNIAGVRGNWCAFDVRDTRDRVALGARLLIEAGGRKQWRRVGATSGYCSSHDLRVYCGLGQAAQVDQLTVHWADGKTTELGPLSAGKLHRVSRGKP